MPLFRLATLAWLASGVARPLMFVTGAFGYATSLGASPLSLSVGAAVCLAIAAFLWLRPGRRSAVAGVLFGFYSVPSLLVLKLTGTPPWLIVLVALGIATFILSVACLWQTRRGNAG